MMSLKVVVVAVTPIMVLAQNAGCSTKNVPTVEQINLNLPSKIRKCKYAPKSPGKGASKKARARYIIKLYNAWEDCSGKLSTVNKLYRKWQRQVRKANR